MPFRLLDRLQGAPNTVILKKDHPALKLNHVVNRKTVIISKKIGKTKKIQFFLAVVTFVEIKK